MDDDHRLARNAYMRDWKKKNREKVNAINASVKAKKPDLYRSFNRLSAAKMRAERPEQHLANSRRLREVDPQRYLSQHAKWRAKKLGVAFDLQPEDIFIPEFCPVLGMRLEWSFGQRASANHNSPSLDRLLPGEGYTKDNVRVISNRANHLKNNATLEELRALVAYVERETR